VAVVIESSTGLPGALAAAHDVDVVPNVVVHAGRAFVCGVDIEPADVLRAHADGPPYPTTSTANPEAYARSFERHVRAGRQVLALLPSAATSANLLAAQEAAARIGDVRVLDTGSLLMGIGWAALIAARSAARGADLDTCERHARAAIDHGRVLGTFEDLDHLLRSGRVDRLRHALATVLSLRPLFTIQRARPRVVGRARGRARALNRLSELAVAHAVGERTTGMRLAVMHADAERDARGLADAIASRVEVDERVVTPFSASTTVHFGRGAIAVALVPSHIGAAP
jgi:DegV family protein with EDD domain